MVSHVRVFCTCCCKNARIPSSANPPCRVWPDCWQHTRAPDFLPDLSVFPVCSQRSYETAMGAKRSPGASVSRCLYSRTRIALPVSEALWLTLSLTSTVTGRTNLGAHTWEPGSHAGGGTTDAGWQNTAGSQKNVFQVSVNETPMRFPLPGRYLPILSICPALHYFPY
jgi:hypothetical protein